MAKSRRSVASKSSARKSPRKVSAVIGRGRKRNISARSASARKSSSRASAR